MTGWLAGLAAVLFLFGYADANPTKRDFICHLRHHAERVDTLHKLPRDVRDALRGHAGAMADRGAFFNATDVVMRPGPFERFIRADDFGAYWSVWYEHGGLAYWKQIVLIDREPVAHVVVSRHSSSGDLCAETDRLLDEQHIPER